MCPSSVPATWSRSTGISGDSVQVGPPNTYSRGSGPAGWKVSVAGLAGVDSRSLGGRHSSRSSVGCRGSFASDLCAERCEPSGQRPRRLFPERWEYSPVNLIRLSPLWDRSLIIRPDPPRQPGATPALAWSSGPPGALKASPMARRNSRLFLAGYPDTVSPGGMSPMIPDWAPTRAPAPISMCPTAPACPPSISPVPHPGGPGDAYHCGHHDTLAHLDVVSQVHQVVQLRSSSHDGAADRPPVDAGVGTDLYVVFHDAGAHLGDLQVLPFPGDVAEPVHSQTYAGVEDHPVRPRGCPGRAPRGDG